MLLCDDLRKELDKINCYIEAWSPIGRGNKELLNEPIFLELGKKYNKTVPQIILRCYKSKKEILFSLKVVIQFILRKISKSLILV